MTEEAENALKALLKSDEMCVTPAQVAPVIGCKAYTINCQAEKGLLNIQHTFIGKKLHIFRIPFLKQLGYDIRPPFEELLDERTSKNNV